MIFNLVLHYSLNMGDSLYNGFFGLNSGIHFAHFGMKSGMVFEGTTGGNECIYPFNSKRLRKKEKYTNSKWILRKPFGCCSNLSNNDIISYGQV